MKSSRIICTLVVLVFSLIFVSGCNVNIAPTSQSSPLSVLESPISTPLIETFALPKPAPGLGVVYGKVVDSQTNQAPAEGLIYLGKVESMDNGSPLVALDRQKAPRGIPITDGRFAIADVPPGEYGVILFTPDISFLLDDALGKSLFVTVTENQTFDLGEIRVAVP